MVKKYSQSNNPFVKNNKFSVANTNQINSILQQAIAFHQMGKLKEAEAIYRNILEIEKIHPEALHLLGLVALQRGDFKGAIDLIGNAIKHDSKQARYYSNLGVAQKELKLWKAALNSFDQAISLMPDFADAYYNRGNALHQLRQFEAAIASFDMAIEKKSNFSIAYCNRGIALQEIKKLDAAVLSFDMAIQLNAKNDDAHYNKGNVLHELGHLDESIDSYTHAYVLNPDKEYLMGVIQQAKMSICDWSNLSNNLSLIESGVLTGKPVLPPFIALTLMDKPDLHLRCSKVYTNLKWPQNQLLGNIPKHSSVEKLKLGYFSADLYYHPVSIWLAELIENHDKSKFEIYAFSLRSDKNDPMKTRLRSAFDHFIEVVTLSDLEIAQLSRKLEIDIAIDLSGFTAISRTGIFAMRAAPIQVNYLGYPGSMGAEYIDYVIADNNVLPESSKVYFSEKVAYVPCPYTYDRQRQISAEPLSRSRFGLPDKGFVFTCQNRCQKFTPEVFSIWMNMLKSVPLSVLWLMEPHASAKLNLLKAAKEHDVSIDRLVFTKREVVRVEQESERIERYLASYQLADLFLDTWPYNAGTTAVDALWAGLPVLTKAGSSAVARMAASALHAIQVPELIVNSEIDYFNLAVELATNKERLDAIRLKLETNRFTTPLFDSISNTKYIEAAFTKMHKRYQADLPPDHIYIQELAT